MICKTCSAELADGAQFCPYCGTAQAVASVTEPTDVPQKPKKKKTGLIVAISVAAVVALAAVLVVMNLGTLVGTAIKTFGTPQQYLAYAEMRQLSSLGKDLMEMGVADEDEIGVVQTIGFDIGEDLSDEIKDSLPKENQDLVDEILAMGIKYQTLAKNDLVYMSMSVTNDNGDLLTVEIYADPKTGDLYLGIPSLSDTYVYQEGEDFKIRDGELKISKKNQERIEELTETYLKLFIQQFDDISEKDTTYTVGDAEEKCTELTLHISEYEVIDALKVVLEDLKTNETFKELIVDLAYEGEDGYDKLIEELDTLIDKLDDELDYAEKDDDLIAYTSYVDKKHNVIGRSLEADGEDIFSYKTAHDGNTDYLTLSVGEFDLKGEVTEKNNKLNGSYSVRVNKDNLATITLTDCDFEKFSGEIRIDPSEDVISELDLPAKYDEPALVIVLNKDKEVYEMDLNLVSDDEMLVSVVYTASVLKGNDVPDITLPDSDDTVDSNNNIQLIKWLSEWDIQGFTEELEDKDVPEELIELFKQTLSSAVRNTF